jgi:hypothetical protein
VIGIGMAHAASRNQSPAPRGRRGGSFCLFLGDGAAGFQRSLVFESLHLFKAGGWSEYKNPDKEGAQAVACFWGFMTVGCVPGLLLLKLFDCRKTLIVAVIAAMIALSVALFAPANAVSPWAFPMAGFFLSVMWSIVFFIRAEFSRQASRLVFGDPLHRRHRRRNRAGVDRLPRRSLWPARWNDLHLSHAGLHARHRHPGETVDQ